MRLVRHRARIAGVLLALVSWRAGAQGTALVPPLDLAYGDLDRLAELGVLDTVIIGQRPYSRREIGRIIRSARRRVDRADVRGSDSLDRDGKERASAATIRAGAILDRLTRRFSDEVEDRAFAEPVIAPLEDAALVFSTTNAIPRRFVGAFGTDLEATLNPLDARRLGRAPIRGGNVGLELSQRLEPTGWLSFQASERAEYRSARDSGYTPSQGELLRAVVRARFKNAALTIGREEFAWAQAEDEGLFLSSRAPALDQVALASDHPFRLPSILGALGPTQATLIYAQLGPSQVRSHSELVAYKVSVQPNRALELGGTFMNHFGGEGGRSSPIGDRLIDMLPFVDIFRSHNYVDSTSVLDVDSDKLLGVDGRLRIAPLAGVLLTGEVLIDDFDVRRIPQLFGGYGSSMIGVTFPVLVNPDWSLELTAKHLGILTYTHSALRSGVTTQGRLLGEPLGPDAKQFGGEVRWMPAPTLRLAVSGRSAQMSNAQYQAFYADSSRVRYIVRKVSSVANELRDDLLASLELRTEQGHAFIVRGGAERIRNANFAGGSRQSYVVDVAVRLRQ